MELLQKAMTKSSKCYIDDLYGRNDVNMKEPLEDPDAIKHNEKVIEMESRNNYAMEEQNSQSPLKINENYQRDMQKNLEDLKMDKTNLKKTVYFQKNELSLLRDTIKQLTGKGAKLSDPQNEFIQEKNSDLSKIGEIIEIKETFSKFWSFGRSIELNFHTLNLKFLNNNEIGSDDGIKKLNQEISHTSDFVIIIKNIEVKSSDGIIKYFFIILVIFQYVI